MKEKYAGEKRASERIKLQTPPRKRKRARARESERKNGDI